MHMLRRQSRRTASKTPSNSESLRGAAQSQPPLMRSRLTTPAPPCVLHSSPSQLPPLTQSIQATSNHVHALAQSLPLFVHRYSASATKSALDNPKHLAGRAHGGSEKRGRLLWLRLEGHRGGVVGAWCQTRKRCLPVLLLWEHFPAPSSCSKHYLALPFAGHALMCQWPRKADNHWRAREWWAPTLPLQPINPTQTSVYPDR